MPTPGQTQDIVIDASGQSLGRVASVAAFKLRGKHLVNFQPNRVPNVRVNIVNIKQLKFTGTKLKTKRYHRFSGYPGGIKTLSLAQAFNRNPERVVRRAVEHMLPKNRLQARLMRHLSVYAGKAE